MIKKILPFLLLSVWINLILRIVQLELFRLTGKVQKGLGTLNKEHYFFPVAKRYNNNIKVSAISHWMRVLIIDAYLYWAGGGVGGSVSGIIALRRPKTHEIRAWAASLA